MLNGLDLFSGYGGISLALGDYVRPIAYCEKERYAQGILLSRMSEGALPAASQNRVRALDGPSMTKIYQFPARRRVRFGKSQSGERVIQIDDRITTEGELSVTRVRSDDRERLILDLSAGDRGFHILIDDADQLSAILDELTEIWTVMDGEQS